MATNRVTSLGVEVIRDGAASARVTSLGVEVIRDGASKARVTSLGTEVLRSASDVVDKYAANCKLLMGYEGANGATGTPGMDDESIGAHGTATVLAGATIGTSQFMFGASSLALNGSGSIRFADHADWHLGSGAFTIEGRIRPTSVTGTQFIIGQWLSTGNLSWILYLNGSQLAWNVSTTGSDNITDMSAGTVTINTWAAVAIDFDGTKYRLYINGIMVASSTTLRTFFTSSNPLSIGSNANNSAFWLGGNVDEIRLTKGTARYASDDGYGLQSVAFPRALTGTWASTEAKDIFSAVGYVGAPGVVGDWHSTEAKDVFAATGSVASIGSWLSTEATDVFHATGTTTGAPPIKRRQFFAT